jgi:phenylacetate-CoA ligase
VTGPKVQQIYDHLPELAQTALLNVYGLRTRKLSGQYNRLLSELAESERWTTGQQSEYVAAKLRLLLDHAIRYVPRYRGLTDLLPALDGDRTDIMEVLGQFPSVTRAEVIKEPDSFLSTAFRKQDLVTTVTSGTTGSPLRTYLEPSVLQLSNALWWRRTVWAGYQEGDWTARLVGDHVVPLSDRHPRRPYRVSHTDRRIYLSTFHLDPATASAMKAALEARRPAFLQGYPSALAALSAAGPCTPEWRPKAVLYSSEPMYEHQRTDIRAFVDAPIRGLYGCAERVVSAAECSSGSLHLSLLDGYVEGQFGEASPSSPALITGLLNRAMQMIRFQLGDAISFQHDAACPCGRTLPVLSPVVTKAEDSVVTDSGRVISPSALTWAFKDLPGLIKSQIIQRRDLTLEVRIVADTAWSHAIASLLEQRLTQMTFGELHISVVAVPDLAVTHAGKTRFVVSEVAASSPRVDQSGD